MIPLLLLLLCMLLAGASPPPPGLADALAPRRVALVVGIDSYDHPAIMDLRFARADAHAVALAMADPEIGRFDEVEELTGPRVDRATLERRLVELSQELGPDDLFLLYFAGHGSLEPGILRLDETQYLYTSETDPYDLAGTALAQEWLRARIAQLPSRRRVVVLDVCRSPFAARSRGTGVENRLVVEDMEVWLHSSMPYQPSEESDGHGLYTRGLLEGLPGKADANQDGLVDVVEAHIQANRSLARRSSRGQRGRITLDSSGDVDFSAIYLAGDPKSRRPPGRANALGLEDLGPGESLLLDGQSWEGDALPPGRYGMSLLRGGQPVLETELEVEPGQYIDMGEELRRARMAAPRVYLGLGGGFTPVSTGGGGLDPWPDGGLQVEGWWLPRSAARWRPAIGLLGECRLGQGDVLAVDRACGSQLRAGLWQGRELVWGPVLGLGAMLTRRPNASLALSEAWYPAPIGSLGLQARIDARRFFFATGLDLRAAWLSVDPAAEGALRWSLLPSFSIGTRYPPDLDADAG